MGKATGLAKEQRRALEQLKRVPGLERFYLAGGTAIAFHLNHRRSFDLDLFSYRPSVDIAKLLVELRSRLPALAVRSSSEVALSLDLPGTMIDIVAYPYPPLEKPTPGPEGFPVAGLADLAAMKFAAIAHRGMRRYFWDLHEIVLAGLTLDDVARAYVKRFQKHESDVYHVVRSLTYFADAEKDPLFPAGLTLRHWQAIKSFFVGEAPGFVERLTTRKTTRK